jgi:hypothetical protein
MNTPIAILEERATYISADGSSQRREDIYVRLSVSFRHEMLKVLKGARLSVFLCLALHGNAEMESWPSISTIAEETGYSDRVVRHAIHSLETMKLVASESRYGDNGGQTSNRYTIAAFVNTPPTNRDTPPVQKCNPPLYESVPGGGCSNVQSKNIHIEEELTSHHEDGCDVDTLFPLPSSLQKKKPAVEKKPPTPHQELYSALCYVCKLDGSLKTNKGRLNKLASELSGYTAVDIRRWYGPGGWWYQEDWRGKQGQAPALLQIPETIRKARERAAPGNVVGKVVMS